MTSQQSTTLSSILFNRYQLHAARSPEIFTNTPTSPPHHKNFPTPTHHSTSYDFHRNVFINSNHDVQPHNPHPIHHHADNISPHGLFLFTPRAWRIHQYATTQRELNLQEFTYDQLFPRDKDKIVTLSREERLKHKRSVESGMVTALYSSNQDDTATDATVDIPNFIRAEKIGHNILRHNPLTRPSQTFSRLGSSLYIPRANETQRAILRHLATASGSATATDVGHVRAYNDALSQSSAQPWTPQPFTTHWDTSFSKNRLFHHNLDQLFPPELHPSISNFNCISPHNPIGAYNNSSLMLFNTTTSKLKIMTVVYYDACIDAICRGNTFFAIHLFEMWLQHTATHEPLHIFKCLSSIYDDVHALCNHALLLQSTVTTCIPEQYRFSSYQSKPLPQSYNRNDDNPPPTISYPSMFNANTNITTANMVTTAHQTFFHHSPNDILETLRQFAKYLFSRFHPLLASLQWVRSSTNLLITHYNENAPIFLTAVKNSVVAWLTTQTTHDISHHSPSCNTYTNTKKQPTTLFSIPLATALSHQILNILNIISLSYSQTTANAYTLSSMRNTRPTSPNNHDLVVDHKNNISSDSLLTNLSTPYLLTKTPLTFRWTLDLLSYIVISSANIPYKDVQLPITDDLIMNDDDTHGDILLFTNNSTAYLYNTATQQTVTVFGQFGQFLLNKQRQSPGTLPSRSQFHPQTATKTKQTTPLTLDLYLEYYSHSLSKHSQATLSSQQPHSLGHTLTLDGLSALNQSNLPTSIASLASLLNTTPSCSPSQHHSTFDYSQFIPNLRTNLHYSSLWESLFQNQNDLSTLISHHSIPLGTLTRHLATINLTLQRPLQLWLRPQMTFIQTLVLYYLVAGYVAVLTEIRTIAREIWYAVRAVHYYDAIFTHLTPNLTIHAKYMEHLKANKAFSPSRKPHHVGASNANFFSPTVPIYNQLASATATKLDPGATITPSEFDSMMTTYYSYLPSTQNNTTINLTPQQLWSIIPTFTIPQQRAIAQLIVYSSPQHVSTAVTTFLSLNSLNPHDHQQTLRSQYFPTIAKKAKKERDGEDTLDSFHCVISPEDVLFPYTLHISCFLTLDNISSLLRTLTQKFSTHHDAFFKHFTSLVTICNTNITTNNRYLILLCKIMAVTSPTQLESYWSLQESVYYTNIMRSVPQVEEKLSIPCIFPPTGTSTSTYDQINAIDLDEDLDDSTVQCFSVQNTYMLVPSTTIIPSQTISRFNPASSTLNHMIDESNLNHNDDFYPFEELFVFDPSSDDDYDVVSTWSEILPPWKGFFSPSPSKYQNIARRKDDYNDSDDQNDQKHAFTILSPSIDSFIDGNVGIATHCHLSPYTHVFPLSKFQINSLRSDTHFQLAAHDDVPALNHSSLSRNAQTLPHFSGNFFSAIITRSLIGNSHSRGSIDYFTPFIPLFASPITTKQLSPSTPISSHEVCAMGLHFPPPGSDLPQRPTSSFLTSLLPHLTSPHRFSTQYTSLSVIHSETKNCVASLLFRPQKLPPPPSHIITPLLIIDRYLTSLPAPLRPVSLLIYYLELIWALFLRAFSSPLSPFFPSKNLCRDILPQVNVKKQNASQKTNLIETTPIKVTPIPPQPSTPVLIAITQLILAILFQQPSDVQSLKKLLYLNDFDHHHNVLAQSHHTPLIYYPMSHQQTHDNQLKWLFSPLSSFTKLSDQNNHHIPPLDTLAQFFPSSSPPHPTYIAANVWVPLAHHITPHTFPQNNNEVNHFLFPRAVPFGPTSILSKSRSASQFTSFHASFASPHALFQTDIFSTQQLIPSQPQITLAMVIRIFLTRFLTYTPQTLIFTQQYQTVLALSNNWSTSHPPQSHLQVHNFTAISPDNSVDFSNFSSINPNSAKIPVKQPLSHSHRYGVNYQLVGVTPAYTKLPTHSKAINTSDIPGLNERRTLRHIFSTGAHHPDGLPALALSHSLPEIPAELRHLTAPTPDPLSLPAPLVHSLPRDLADKIYDLTTSILVTTPGVINVEKSLLDGEYGVKSALALAQGHNNGKKTDNIPFLTFNTLKPYHPLEDHPFVSNHNNDNSHANHVTVSSIVHKCNHYITRYSIESVLYKSEHIQTTFSSLSGDEELCMLDGKVESVGDNFEAMTLHPITSQSLPHQTLTSSSSLARPHKHLSTLAVASPPTTSAFIHMPQHFDSQKNVATSLNQTDCFIFNHPTALLSFPIYSYTQADIALSTSLFARHTSGNNVTFAGVIRPSTLLSQQPAFCAPQPHHQKLRSEEQTYAKFPYDTYNIPPHLSTPAASPIPTAATQFILPQTSLNPQPHPPPSEKKPHQYTKVLLSKLMSPK